VEGLRAKVTVTRDQWGIPHIVAANTDDLFFAQGFVQAQDRLFQMDLWKRSVQGRLSEVLGANFIQRDSMTRRIQFRGDLGQEWASYGPDARRIAVAFTSGINAWVRIARRDPPEEFALAGWQPEFWRPDDLLNRTDAFMASTGALVELLRARLISAVGLRKATVLLPSAGTGGVQPDPEVDLSAITFIVSDAVRRIGTPPFFLTLAGAVSDAPRPGQEVVNSQQAGGIESTSKLPSAGRRETLPGLPAFIASRPTVWVDEGRGASSDGPRVGIEIGGALVAPSRAYLVHLTAPGWNVIGATRPWLPGVVFGHNERIAWAMTPLPIDTQDIAVERVNPADPHQVWHDGRWVDMSVDHERVAVKGRDQPVEYERLYTWNGVVIAQDKERGLVYTLRWTGTEPGGAGELAALNLGRADSWSRFRETMNRWIAPPAEFVYADVSGEAKRWQAGIVPQRRGRAGATPSSGWSNARIWSAFTRLSDGEALGSKNRAGELPQSDWSTMAIAQLLNSTSRIGSLPGDAADVLNKLRTAASPYWMLRLFYTVRRTALEQMGIPDELRDEVLYAVDPATPDTDPLGGMFGGDSDRNGLLASALRKIGDPSAVGGASGQVTFEHPLAVFDSSRRRFNVSVVPRPSSGGRSTERVESAGIERPRFGAVFNTSAWDRSTAMNSPGQSGSPASTHYDDLAARWAGGDDIYLSFAQSRESSDTQEILTLQPREGPIGPDVQ